MTRLAIRSARVVPGLRPNTGAGPDEDAFDFIGREQIGVALVESPFIRHPIDAANGIDDQHPSLEPARRLGIRFVGPELEMLYEHRANRKTPFAGWAKMDCGG